jgi:hypothetical protein
MKALKIIAIVFVIGWMAWITWRLEQVEYLSRYACAASVAETLRRDPKAVRHAPNPYECPWIDFDRSAVPGPKPSSFAPSEGGRGTEAND